MNSTTLSQPSQKEAAAFPMMMQMMTGFWGTQCIYVAAKLTLPDLLANGPKSAEALASEAQANPAFLYRVLRALAGMGIFEETQPGTFKNTPLSDLLKTASTSLRAFALMMGEEHYQAWGKLVEGVQSGQAPFELTYGMPVFEYFAQNARPSEIFNQAMTSFAAGVHSAAAHCYDFSGFKTLVDVGGGHGKLLETLLSQNPALKGILFDLEHVIAGAQVLKDQFGERVSLVGGDFFQSVASGGDAYILSTVIHDWSDDLALKILRNIHAAMPAQATLLLVEHVIEVDNRPSMGKMLDINMLAMTQVPGQEGA
jgi:O-methyltransferase domain/Dimerisation domain